MQSEKNQLSGVINYLPRVKLLAREWEWQSEDTMVALQNWKTSHTIIVTQLGINRGFI